MQQLQSTRIDTPIGEMIAIGDESHLYFLEFLDGFKLEKSIASLKNITRDSIIAGKTPPILSIEKELSAYFEGVLKKFTTPLFFIGSNFQKNSWDALIKVPFGETRSYKEQATSIGKPSAYRAVANANGRNKLIIVVPCHRIITSGGTIGGYSSGIEKKEWLLEHEKKISLMKP
jgi:AraC family transcriptional regulator, regulatory protein of adaptative response / methylated-DNA-[protein]-cysteine methyltransferase